MTDDELALNEYKILHDGYISRDGLVPTEFSQMLRSFLILLAVVAATKILIGSHQSIGSFLYLLVSLIGFNSLLAYAINIESKASSKKALRGRMADIEKLFADKNQNLRYWHSVVSRDKSTIESLYKHKLSDFCERGSASGFFVFSSWVLVFVWVVIVSIMYFGNIQWPSVGM